LLTQSLQSVQRQEPGFTLDRVFVASIGLPSNPSSTPQAIALAERGLLAAVAARPNVQAVAAAYDHPLAANWSESPVLVGESTAEDDRRQLELRIVSPEYFETLAVELVDGRGLSERDTLDARGVAVVNEAFAREVRGRILGRTLRSNTPRFLYGNIAPNEFEIVGVVENERFRGLEQPSQPAFYLSTRQFPQTGFSLLVRTSADPRAITPDILAVIRSTDSGITFNDPTTLAAILDDQLVSRRITTEVIGGFAAAALALAALGMYGLLAVLVGSRRREIGVRLAMGASPTLVARAVVGDSLRSALAGVGLGAALALVSGRLIQSFLVGVSAADPITLGIVGGLLLAVGVCAALVPARRAARIDPVEALRTE
jgi:predicted permease